VSSTFPDIFQSVVRSECEDGAQRYWWWDRKRSCRTVLRKVKERCERRQFCRRRVEFIDNYYLNGRDREGELDFIPLYSVPAVFRQWVCLYGTGHWYWYELRVVEWWYTVMMLRSEGWRGGRSTGTPSQPDYRASALSIEIMGGKQPNRETTKPVCRD